MARIKILPEILANKIAAGEVVERPASVVKELMENALDAGSSRVMIEVERGGRSLIRVSDDGSGMGHDEALLALERYATSKIHDDQDLFAIRTLGFRGEALPSIAAVARLTLVTREAASEVGTRIDVAGGRITQVQQVGAPVGTMVTAAQLFYNTPARRKFLKTIATEMAHVAEVVDHMALGWPAVHFRLLHNGKTVKSWAPTRETRQRVGDVLGRRTAASLIPLAVDRPELQIQGWIAAPPVTRSTTRAIYVYVNGRFVRDKVLQHAVLAGCKGRLLKGQYPVAVLFVTVPCQQVDVNVHPTKHEVRLAAQQAVHAAVAAAVAEALGGAAQPRWSATAGQAARVAEPLPSFKPTAAPVKRAQLPAPLQQLRPPQPSRTPQPSLWDQGRFGSLRLIGQLQDTYLLCEAGDGMIIIDQHAAHERIVFEALLQRWRREGTAEQASQGLLMPETVEVGFKEADALGRLLPHLVKVGLEVEPFGGNTFVVKAIPPRIDAARISALVVALAEKTVQLGTPPDVEEVVLSCLRLMACHGSVRANQKLAPEEQKALLSQLDRCENPSNCPHGRPTWVKWHMDTLAKAFKRIV